MDHAGGPMLGIAPDHVPALVAVLVLPAILWLCFVVLKLAARLGVVPAARLQRGYHAASRVTRAAAALLAVTAAIHLALVPAHAGEEPARAWLFLLDGLGFAAMSIAPFLARYWRLPAAALLVLTVFAYAGVVASHGEDADQVGIATKLVELAALGLVLIPDRSAARSRHPRLRWTLSSLAVVLVGTVTAAILWAAALQPHEPAPVEAATPAQRAAADRLVAETRALAERYRDVSVAIADGYHATALGDLPLVHYENKRYGKDNRILDPARPEQLVYLTTKDGPLLVGAGFVMPGPRQDGPRVGGALTRWHAHHVCISFIPPFFVSLVSPFGACPTASAAVLMPQMLHVWFVDNPRGPFADNLDEDVVRRLRGR